jgi:hypothetical protein
MNICRSVWKPDSYSPVREGFMKGDFSRQTFKADKHYSAVLMQQGRVQLDADWNEQQAIQRHRAERTDADVIGPSGAPQTLAGFQITPQGNNLLIGKGHFYVDGILCENEKDVLFSAQPDLRAIPGDLFSGERRDTDPAAATNGLYLAYLEVWQRHITALEDDEIREKALGGPDTTTRTQTVWQVRLLRLTDPGGTVTCNTNFAEWNQLLAENLVNSANVGKMSAQSQPVEPTPDPLCILPPSAGYRGLENQLYRVEIHRGGNRVQARFKWSRDNGTVASAIVPQDGAVIQGSVINVAEIGKDGMLTFASDPLPEWLELADDRYDLLHQHGALARLQAVDPATRTITFAPGTLPVLDSAQHPIVRRWDQRGNEATDGGVAMTGNWQALEGGVQVRFGDGIYRVGDFWLIPARTAIGLETGTVEWPRAGELPVAQAPHGMQHHFARLALLRFNAGAFSAVANGDCRRLFPPLTAIRAADVTFSDSTCQLGSATHVQQALDILCQRNGSLCTLLIGPGEDLATAIQGLGAAQDALICLRVGAYPLTQPLRIENRRHIQVMGAGPGTQIVAATSEAALIFSNCTSVKVSNLHVETGAVGRGNQATTDLKGALTFLNCPAVTVEGAAVHCAGGPLRAATCITVRHTEPASGSQAHIHGCELAVGHLQAGMLLVNVERSHVTDNLVRAGARPVDDALLQDVDYRATLRRQLLSAIVAGAAGAAPPANTNATVTFNDQIVHFRSDPGLVRGNRNDTEWQRAINAINPPGITSPALLERFLRRLASDLLRTRGGGDGGSAAFRNVITTLLAQDTSVAEQAIVLAGTLAADVQVIGNTVRAAVQGIHVGLSAGAAAAVAGVVVIRDNTIRVSLPTSATRERHGIFVGNCNSLVIESNFISVVRATRNAGLRAEGMRLFGSMGRRVIVRHNHIGPQFAVGITFAPLNTPVPTQPLWIITENEMEAAPTKVDVPGKQPGQPGSPDPGTVRQRVRGINDNFA